MNLQQEATAAVDLFVLGLHTYPFYDFVPEYVLMCFSVSSYFRFSDGLSVNARYRVTLNSLRAEACFLLTGNPFSPNAISKTPFAYATLDTRNRVFTTHGLQNDCTPFVSFLERRPLPLLL